MHYLIHAYRSLTKGKLFTMLGILGFAAGLSVFICILLFVDHEFRMDTVYENHNRIFRLIDASDNNADLDYDIFSILKEKYPEIELACPVRQKEKWPFLFQSKNDFIETESFISTTNEFFDLFSIKILQSSSSVPLPGSHSIVITQSTAHKLFGEANPIGQQIILSGNINLTVTALIGDIPDKSSFKAGFILNANEPRFRFGKEEKNEKIINPINHFVRLKKNIDVAAFTANLNRTLQTYTNSVKEVVLQPVSSIYLTHGINGNYNKSGSTDLIFLFGTIAVLILSLSLINYIHFVLAGQRSNLKATGIKFAHGAGLRHLIAYYFSESAISLLVSLALALILVKIMMPIANALFNCTLYYSSIFSWQVLSVIIVTIFLIIVIVSLISLKLALRIRFRSLWNQNLTNIRSRSGKGVLNVAQLVASIVLLVCVIVIYNQLTMVKGASLGFQSEHLIRLDPPSSFRQFDALKNKIKECPFVKDCSWSGGTPGEIINYLLGGKEGERFPVQGIGVDMDFLNTMGIEKIEGRDFLNSDLDKVCFINQSALKKMNFKNLDEIKSQHETIWHYNIVGVVKDFHIASFHSSIDPVCLFFTQNEFSDLNIRLMPGNVPEQMAQLKQIWIQLIPDYPFSPTFYDDYFDSLYQAEERQGKAIAFFSLIAMIITCMGLLGQIIYACLSRSKEIGIRKVNGARTAEVMAMLNRDFAVLTAIAFLIACPIAYYAMDQWLQNFAYKTELSWWVFAAAGLVAVAVAVITITWQSWRAATRNPVEALRYE